MIQLVKRMSVKEDLDKVGIDEFQDNQGQTNTDVCNLDAVKSGRLRDAVSVDDVHQADSADGVTIRRRKLTKKGREYQQKILFDKRKNLHARMTRKSKLIDDLMYSSKNLTTVREEMHQYDDQFKMLVETHNEYMKLLTEDLHEGQENWFEAVEEVVFTQKHKVYNWMREAENDNKSNKSSRSSKRSSDRSSKKSSHSSKSKSSEGSSGKASLEQRALEGKLKIAELLAEASFTEEKHAAILNAEKLRQSEELAKVKARTQVLDKINKVNPDPANVNMGAAKPDEKENQIKADKIVEVEKSTKKLNRNAEAFKSKAKESNGGEIMAC